MARDIQEQVGRVGQFLDSDTGRQLLGAAVSELLGGFGASKTTKAKNKAKSKAKKVAREGTKEIGGVISSALGDGLSGAGGLAAGAGAAALAPVAIKGISKLVGGNGGSFASAPKKIAEGAAAGPKKLAEGAVSKVGDKVTDKIDEAGGPSGILKDTLKSALPFGGGDGGEKNDAQGVGKGRRMPIQQSIDIPLPVETVYNQWTRFDEWPKFMHRVKRVTQEDPCTVSFAVKIWGKTKEFTAKIETQRPDDRVKWKTTGGMTHAGVVMFRELGPNMTRVILSFDLDPGGLLEKYARGARYVKRAARADLHRFAAFIEMLEHETGAWRGRIEDGEVVEDHDPSYDRKRKYASADDLLGSSDDDDSDDDDSDDDDSDEGRNGGDPEQRSSSPRSSKSEGRSRASSSRSSSRSPRSSSASPRSSGGSSRSSGGSSRRSGRSGSSSSGSGRSGSSGSGGSGRSSGSSRRASGSASSRSGTGSRSSGTSGKAGTSGKTASSRKRSGSSRASSRGSSGTSARSSGSSSSGTSGKTASSRKGSGSSRGSSATPARSSGSTRGSGRGSANGSGSSRSSAGKGSAKSRSAGSSGAQSRPRTRSGSRS